MDAGEEEMEILSKGALLYHGTRSPDRFELNRETPDGPAWFSDDRGVAEQFVTYHGWVGDERPGVLTYRIVSEPENILVIWNEQDMREITERFGETDAVELARAVCEAGYDGWLIPGNYPGGADIMLCEPESYLELVDVNLLYDEDAESEDSTTTLRELWQDFLDGYEILDRSTWLECLREFDPPRKEIEFATGEPPILVLEHNGKRYVVESEDGQKFDVEPADEWFHRAIAEVGRYVDLDRIAEFFGTTELPPGGLYHGTSCDKADEILRRGLLPMDETRGLSVESRMIGEAVFTSPIFDEARYYGDCVIYIDTDAMIADGFLPEVSSEPDYLRFEAIRSLAGLIFDDEADRYTMDFGMDVSPETVIIYDAIPPKYLSLVE